MDKKPLFYGWIVVAALWVAYFLNMGFPLYAGSVINSYMIKEISMDRATYGMGFTLINLCTGGLAVFVGFAVARFGVRKTMWFGCALNMLGALVLAFWASAPWHYLLGFGILMGTGESFACVVPSTTTCMRWFTRFRGRAIAIVLTASAFGGFVGAPLFNKLLATNGGDWRQAWLIVAAGIALTMVIIYLFVKERPEEIGAIPDGGAGPAAVQADANSAIRTTYDWQPKEVFRTSAFWLVLVGSIACKIPFFFFTAHGILHAKGAGISAADAAMIMGLFTLGGIPGRLIGGWLMDKIPGRFVFMMGLCCYIAGDFIDIFMTGQTALAYIASLLIGAGFGWTFVAVNTIPGQYFGPKAFSKVNGTYLTLSGAISSPIGALGGYFYDLYHSYVVSFSFCIAVCIVGILALAFARMPKPPAQKVKEAIGI